MFTDLNPFAIGYTIAAVVGITYQFVKLCKPLRFIGYNHPTFYDRFYIPVMSAIIPLSPFYAKALSLCWVAVRSFCVPSGPHPSYAHLLGIFFGVVTASLLTLISWFVFWMDTPYGNFAHTVNIELYRVRIVAMWLIIPYVWIALATFGIGLGLYVGPWLIVPIYVVGMILIYQAI